MSGLNDYVIKAYNIVTGANAYHTVAATTANAAINQVREEFWEMSKKKHLEENTANDFEFWSFWVIG